MTKEIKTEVIIYAYEAVVDQDENDEDVVEEHYGVKATGEAEDVFGQEIFEDFEDSIVDAHDLAKQIADDCGIEITWECYKPGWAR
ncbi:hypothetical protein phiAS5_ORF0196 [Aeromonas phage phiAS5]|uniref:Uncharacterized protein n=1 Tax=Aeromonas phage phiAS5 TaxID=879630 RepID=E1A2U3_9CAUD|nr:hypothetical protein phiAS5_ORF0196 [Aeromonas phage phiAS5]ADM80039.1 hypothetical protein phiAS5_ORF0196 [Aeromonas phage phiAS5]